MYTIVTEFRKIDRQQWVSFVTDHPYGNTFHLPEMVELYEATNKLSPIVVACLDETNQMKGLLVAVEQKEYNGVIGRLTARAIVWGGPLVKDDNPDATAIIIASFNKLCKGKVIYSQFRNLWDIQHISDVFTSQGYVYEEHLNILIDLTKTEDQLWKEVHSKRRNEIRRAERQMVNVRLLETEEYIGQSYDILHEVYQRAKLPLYNKDFFINAFKFFQPQKGISVFGAFHEDKLIGTLWAFSFKGVLYDWYAGSYSEYYGKYPNDLIPWEIFKWGQQNNFHLFDFGGAGKPDKPYGVREYKKKFGGEFVNFGRFEKIHMPIMMIFAKMGFKIWRKLRKK